MLGVHIGDIVEAFHQHISWPAMTDWDKTVQQKAQGIHFKVPTSKRYWKGEKKIMQIINVTFCAEMTTEPAAQLNYH